MKLKRKWNCTVCKKELTAKKIMNGFVLSCGCGDIFTHNDLTKAESFEKIKE